MDPINRANRWGQRIERRPYSVRHPNFLWHIDSNLKLGHWRMVIHGCIDGFSCCIIISFLTGLSTRNRCIEHLWTDVVECVVTIFTSLFMFTEANNLLDPGSDDDMFALHYVFLPRVQRLLDRFVQRFNMHSVLTEISTENVELYGHDPDATLPDPEDDQSGVEVATINLELSQDVQSTLNQNFNPLLEDNIPAGVQIYKPHHQ